MTADFESIAMAESSSQRPVSPRPVSQGPVSQGPVRPSPVSPRPVRPSPFVRIVMGPLTKRFNPLMLKLAGRDNFRMAAQVRHVGRRSGRSYVTPVSARLGGGVAVIPLTFGNVSDWALNIRAGGGCEIRLAGQEYVASNPQFVEGQEIRPLLRSLFARRERAMFTMLGIVQFIRLDVAPVNPVGVDH